MAKGKEAETTANPPGAGSTPRGLVATLSDVGRTRSNNEDNFIVLDVGQKKTQRPREGVSLSFVAPGFLLVVADGMGGHSSGQVASQLCVDTVPAEVLKALPESAATAEEYGQALRQAVETANEVIHTAAQRESANKGMGTTMTAAWLVGTQAVIAQVGDSRAYLLHKGQYTQLTQDQTVLNSVSEVEREALLNTPFENMLLQAVGALPQLDVALTTTDLSPGDFLLLCSDGLYRVVKPEQMAEVLQRPEPLAKKAETLIQMANDGGGPDNVTVILCEVQAGEAG
jgi:serine/threonine protein phosphatase PrpC